MFDITVEGGRPVVKYAAALSSATLRTGTMVTCGLLFVFFMGLLLHTEGQLLDLIYANKPDNASAGDILSKLFQMVLWGGVGCVFSVQGLILKRSKERLERIAALIEESFPSAGSEPGPEGTSVTA